VIELPAGVHLSRGELRALLDVIESAITHGARPGPRADHTIHELRRVLRETDEAARKGLRARAPGGVVTNYRLHDLVDSAEAARILGISAAGVRDLYRRGQLAGHRANGRILYPVASVIERAERIAERRASKRG
jgi:helix-turn-helix protein